MTSLARFTGTAPRPDPGGVFLPGTPRARPVNGKTALPGPAIPGIPRGGPVFLGIWQALGFKESKGPGTPAVWVRTRGEGA
jgi:hypothetical protein